jgi:hypothetical protein
MLKQSSSGIKKVLAVLLIGFFVLPLTAVAVSAQGYYADSNYHTYITGQPGYILLPMMLLHIGKMVFLHLPTSPMELIPVTLMYYIVTDHQVVQKAPNMNE